MRIYIIGSDGITLCPKAPATVDDGEIAVASNEELHAAPLSAKRLLALWNALPGVDKRKKVGDRDALIDQLWSAIELLPDPEPEALACHTLAGDRPRARTHHKRSWILGFSSHLFISPTHWRKGELAPGCVAAEIALRNLSWIRCSTCTRPHAGSLANAGVADERVRGLLIKRRRPLEAVALLEPQKRPLCPRPYYAVERTIVEPHIVKLYLCPPDVVFREIRRS
jgi:hypothetical protein